MKKITRWSPDTCGCVLEFEWDTNEPQETRVHTPIRSVNKCDAHKIHIQHDKHFNIVMEENSTKNKAVELLRKNHSYLTKKDQDGNDVLVDGVIFKYDEDRTLKLTHKDLKQEDKAKFQNIIDDNIKNLKITIK